MIDRLKTLNWLFPGLEIKGSWNGFTRAVGGAIQVSVVDVYLHLVLIMLRFGFKVCLNLSLVRSRSVSASSTLSLIGKLLQKEQGIEANANNRLVGT